jgi:ribosome-associated protein
VEAFARLIDLVHSVAVPPKVRRPTKPTYGSKQRRLESKKKNAHTKAGRTRVQDL